MKLTTGILVMMMAGGAWAQNPTIIQSTQDKMNAVQQQKVADSNAALGVSQPQAKPSPAGPGSTGSKPAPSKPAPKPPASKPAPAKPAASAVPAPKTGAAPATTPKTVTMPPATGASSAAAPVAKKAAAPKTAEKKATAKPIAVIVPKAAKSGKKQPKQVVQAQTKPAEKPQEKEKKYSMVGKRDPFISPVVNHMGGSGCNTGKKCLEIGQINLKGVVRADTGMIAVVTNSMNKAYFLRENDPVFNGYVEKITGDSIVFKETFQDKLGKSFTRDVVKKILTPAV